MSEQSYLLPGQGVRETRLPDLPQPGDFCLSMASSWWLRAVGRYAFGTERFHSATYVGNGQIVHASIRFGGTKLDSVHSLIDPIWISPDITLTQRQAIVEAALDQVGEPFPAALPLAVGLLLKFRGDATKPAVEQAWWVREVLANGGYCLRQTALAYRRGGCDLFPDHPDLLVLPKDYYALMTQTRDGVLSVES